jgi:phospho-N-acetylmuramoyl-pentapeptide-transferase
VRVIYRLLYDLHDVVSGFNVFRYITFRAALAALTALMLSLLLGPWLIRRLREFQVGQSIREEGPQSHRPKAGTPTMGGLLILIAILLATAFWADVGNPLIILALVATTLFGAIGFVDDWQKLLKRRNLGLTARGKLGLQLLVSAGVGGTLVWLSGRGQYDLRLGIPFVKHVMPDLGALYVPFAMVVIVSAANAVNLTDGLDGLAIGATGVCFATFALVSYVVGHAVAAGYLGVTNVKNAGEVAVFCAAVVGASLGFLWFNCSPAQVFMGDVGSMGLGGALGTVAVAVKQELLLVIVGGLFVIEALSVVLQVATFKASSGQLRLFKMTPLHHHFEAHRVGHASILRGHDWAEQKVVVRFWILAILFALTGLSTLKVR